MPLTRRGIVRCVRAAHVPVFRFQYAGRTVSSAVGLVGWADASRKDALVGGV